MNTQSVFSAQPDFFGTNSFGHSSPLVGPLPVGSTATRLIGRSPLRANPESGKFSSGAGGFGVSSFGWEIWGAAIYAAVGVSGVLAAYLSVVTP